MAKVKTFVKVCRDVNVMDRTDVDGGLSADDLWGERRQGRHVLPKRRTHVRLSRGLILENKAPDQEHSHMFSTVPTSQQQDALGFILCFLLFPLILMIKICE